MTLQYGDVVVEDGELISCITKERVCVSRMVYVVNNCCY